MFIFKFIIDIVLTGGSDKSIEIFDMNQAKSCLFIPDAHTRNFHQIYQNESEHNQSSYDLFLTNAVSDGIKLWDLRIAQCVNKFDYHLNRCLPIKVSMSPDSNYIVAGAEDRSVSFDFFFQVYIYFVYYFLGFSLRFENEWYDSKIWRLFRHCLKCAV